MRNFSIGFVAPSSAWGGLEINVYRLAVWLKQRDWNIIFYGIPDSPLYENCRKSLIEVRAIAATSKISNIKLAWKLAQYVKKDNVRILVLHTNRNFLMVVLAKILSKYIFKLIYNQHMHIGRKKKDFFHTWEYNHLESWVVSLPVMEQDVIKNTNVDTTKISIIPHGIELERFTNHKLVKKDARNSLKLPSNVFIVGVVGRLDSKKCQHVLIEACTRVHQAGYPIHLLIVGDISYNEENKYARDIFKLTEQLGLKDYIHFRPYMKDIEYAYASMDLFALTSMSETYGMVTIEAMACGLPVIGTNDGGTRDIIQNNVNGILVEPLDVNELTKAIIRFISDKELSGKLARQAKEDVVNNYSHTRQCDLLESLFGKLMMP